MFVIPTSRYRGEVRGKKRIKGGGVEGLQAPIVEDQKIGTAEIAQETRMATVAARQREILE